MRPILGARLPWKSRVLVRAQFEFAQRVTLGMSNIIPPRYPSPSTLTNHIGVSDIGGPKVLLLNQSNTAYLLVSSTGLDTSPLVFF